MYFLFSLIQYLHLIRVRVIHFYIMASSYSGDPRFLANNPFLDMLAMVEDEENVQQGPSHAGQQPVHRQQQQVDVRGSKVKLPEFWSHAPGMWFARAELRFTVCGVTSEMEKFAYAADALQYEAMRLVTDLITAPPADRPYTALKERLLLAHQLTPIQKAQKVMNMPSLGDRRPSQLLATLLEFCPTGEENTAFFRSAFLHRLPNDLQVSLDGVETEDLKVLAQRADRLWLTRGTASTLGPRVAAVEAASELEEETSCVAAVKQQFTKKYGNSGGNGGGNGGGTGGSNSGGHHGGHGGGQRDKRKSKLLSICRAHMRYGAEAYRCQDTQNCAWSGN